MSFDSWKLTSCCLHGLSARELEMAECTRRNRNLLPDDRFLLFQFDEECGVFLFTREVQLGNGPVLSDKKMWIL